MQSLNQIIAQIRPLDRLVMEEMSIRLDGLVKPVGSLGRLEQLAIQLSGIYRNLNISASHKQLIVMAADHGVYAEGITLAPQAVTYLQMLNMVKGVSGVCVLAKQMKADVLLVDTGIDSLPIEGVLNYKVRRSSGNIATQAAMSREEAITLLERSARLAIEQVNHGVRLIGTGELGMGNTTPAAAIVSVLCDAEPEHTVGVGANFPQDRMQHRIEVVRRAIAINQPDANDSIDVLAKVGGFDLGGMAGIMIGAAAAGVPIVLDGFLSCAAALIAVNIAPQIHPYLIPSHRSAEKGTQLALEKLNLVPYLEMSMRLGEGSGAVMAFPIIDAACAMATKMGSLNESNILLSD
ncbi:nicotinate-nucleotide--dimethylbenzimidazole phosphoribosyltransferase [Budviciaceae bacterium BWR-B9]|uniref:Nicotinate-nucleotide--dimethylbenzimidazole phosphoribosyltransferase n=1 Tax=Limnobaculum allomyrinae TaxID=2791986 RepID=A0ABS1ILR6_9GAMM|nr:MULTISPECIES: nicotinate-nucleotide--dimethylbenzimidazole phosphoribosyltransferase [Limnobaculum]MBK5142652.1 nicotinate-nucleotide--dimethylbenzimidazole phosphoribosyltransferase [Limnobaculum allomyrinae]MBV7690462.1 nicotinate-nucleotide--dimethylbenzimidazole phosphoribosyltransferase [Limnobaculum sp. M2-1]